MVGTQAELLPVGEVAAVYCSCSMHVLMDHTTDSVSTLLSIYYKNNNNNISNTTTTTNDMIILIGLQNAC